MDKLFDLFNSSHIKHYKESRCALGMISFKIEIISNHGYHFGMTDFFLILRSGSIAFLASNLFGKMEEYITSSVTY